MKRMACYNYLNHATTCDQLYKFVRHLQRAHGQIPSKITINRQAAPIRYQTRLQAAYERR